jgi:hypothetical protein
MDFNVGDQVIHWTFGPGEIIGVDKKSIDNRTTKYYVFRTNELTVWVPVEEQQSGCGTPSQYKFKLSEILLRGSAGRDRNLRKITGRAHGEQG